MDRVAHLRHHPARRRAVARRDAQCRREAGDRAPTGPPGRGHHRGRLPDRLARRLRRRAAHRRAGATGRSSAAWRAPCEGDVDRCWEAIKRRAAPAHPRLHVHQRHPPGAPVPQVAAGGAGGDARDGGAGARLLRRHRVLAHGRHAHRARLPLSRCWRRPSRRAPPP